MNHLFCRRGFGWVDKAQCFRSARRFGAAGSSSDFSRGFSRHGASWPLSWTFFQCTLLSYPGQPSYSHVQYLLCRCFFASTVALSLSTCSSTCDHHLSMVPAQHLWRALRLCSKSAHMKADELYKSVSGCLNIVQQAVRRSESMSIFSLCSKLLSDAHCYVVADQWFEWILWSWSCWAR